MSTLAINVVWDSDWIEQNKAAIISAVEQAVEDLMPDSVTNHPEFDLADHVEWDVED
jgi:hypothetical protein